MRRPVDGAVVVSDELQRFAAERLALLGDAVATPFAVQPVLAVPPAEYFAARAAEALASRNH